MDTDPPLEHMLSDGGGPPAGRDELQAIVARSGRRRTRIAAMGMIGALAVGAAVGWAANSGRSSPGTSLAAGAASTTIPGPQQALAAANGGGSFASALAVAPLLTKKFVRTTADGVTIRGYLRASPKGFPAACGVLLSGFQAEVSTVDVAGTANSFGAPTSTAPFTMITPMTLGEMENAPVSVVTVNTIGGAAQVRVTFADGKTDQMAPVEGWSVLAHLGGKAGSKVSVDALDAGGKVVGTQEVDPLLPPRGPKVVVPATLPPGITGTGSTRYTGPVPTTTVLANNGPGNSGPGNSAPSLPTATARAPVPCNLQEPVPAKGGASAVTTVPSPNVTPATVTPATVTPATAAK